jgi:hypothetical protein
MIEQPSQAPPADGTDETLFLVKAQRGRRETRAPSDLADIEIARGLDLKST